MERSLQTMCGVRAVNLRRSGSGAGALDASRRGGSNGTIFVAIRVVFVMDLMVLC